MINWNVITADLFIKIIILDNLIYIKMMLIKDTKDKNLIIYMV